MSRSERPPWLPVPGAALLAMLDADGTAWRRPLTFSCNARGEIWRHATNGLTPHNERVSVGHVPLLRVTADALMRLRPCGGRFEFRPDTMSFVAVADHTCLLRVIVTEVMA